MCETTRRRAVRYDDMGAIEASYYRNADGTWDEYFHSGGVTVPGDKSLSSDEMQSRWSAEEWVPTIDRVPKEET